MHGTAWSVITKHFRVPRSGQRTAASCTAAFSQSVFSERFGVVPRKGCAGGRARAATARAYEGRLRPLEISPRHPVINLTFGFVTRDAIPFLNPTEELFALAMNSVNIV